MFHRLTTPTYFGGLPGGYDYINDPVANGDSGVAAFADAKKTGGANDGTYFVAFQEDASSSNANRGMKALAENTDLIDDILRKDLALTARTANATAASPVSQIVLSGYVFVGEFGVTNNQDMRDRLISILDGNDNEIIDATGTKVQALLIHNGSSSNVVGTTAAGFFNSPTVNLNVAIPTGTVYRVYYGERGNLASLPKDAFTNIKIRGAQEISGETERVLRDLHATAGTTLWNDPWTANINSLARTGLDGRYRLSTTDPGTSPALDTPGNGGTITRDGPALTMLSPNNNLGAGGIGLITGTRYPDPILASYRIARASPTNGTTWDPSRGGDHGLVQESPYHTYGDANEVAAQHVTGPLVLDMIPRDVRASTLGTSDPVLTRISTTGVGSVNPTAGSDATSRRTIELAAGDFTRDGSNRTGLRKTDLIEVINNATGLVVGTFRVDSILSDTRLTLKALSGANPEIGASGTATAARFRWLQPTISIGGQYRDGSGDVYGPPALLVAQPGFLTSDWESNKVGVAALFLSAASSRALGDGFADHYTALAWGGFADSGFWTMNGRLYGDGGMFCAGGRQELVLVNRSSSNATFSVTDGGRTCSHNPLLAGAAEITTAALTIASPVVYTLDTSTGYVPADGDELHVTFYIAPSTVGPFSVTWPGTFKFSGNDGVLPTTNPSTTTAKIIHFEFVYKTIGLTTGWYGKRWDF